MAKGAVTLTEMQLAAAVAETVGGGFSRADVTKIIKALKTEMTEYLQSGYKVGLTGLIILTPVAKPGRKKGSVIRNPFDGTTRTLRADEPGTFKVRATVSKGVRDGFPSLKSQSGQDLHKQLTPVKSKGK